VACGALKSEGQKFNAVRDAQLLENAEQVVLDGMLAQTHPAPNLRVGQTFCEMLDDFLFSLGQHIQSGGPRPNGAGKGLEGTAHFPAVGPDLSFVNRTHTFTKVRDRVLPAEDSTGPGSERLHDHLTLVRFEKDNDWDVGIAGVELTQSGGAEIGVFVQRLAEDGNVRRAMRGEFEELVGGTRGADNAQTAVPAESITKELGENIVVRTA
jgi:hypothetical protein